MKVIIVGAVADGTLRAARLRRLHQRAEIIMEKQGSCVSYAGRGSLYQFGGVIEEETSLLVASQRFFPEQFPIDADTNRGVTTSEQHKRCRPACRIRGLTSRRRHWKRLAIPGGATP